jgi:hypothetical protein
VRRCDAGPRSGSILSTVLYATLEHKIMGRKRHRPRAASLWRAPADAELVLAWYTREAWQHLVAVADDREALDETFEDWERQALTIVRELESNGRNVRKIPIVVDGLVAWCRARGYAIDSKARAAYVCDLLEPVSAVQGRKHS